MVAAPESVAQAHTDASTVTGATAAVKHAAKLANGDAKQEAHVQQQQQQAQQQSATGTQGASAEHSQKVVDGQERPAHSASPDSAINLPPADVARNIPCRYFPLGQCKYGEKCIFSHGIPGVAGSPGVPSTAEDVPAQGKPQTEQMVYAPQMVDYGQQMPIYYGAGPEQGFEYGYQPAYPVQPGFYPFPPPFQMYQYQQGIAQQGYYQPAMMHPMQQSVALNGAPVPSESPMSPTSPAEHLQASSAPESLRATSPASASPAPLASPSTHAVPLVAQQHQAYQAYGNQTEFGFAASPASPFGQDGVPLAAAPQQQQQQQQQRPDHTASLHTFFQTTSASATPSVIASVAPNGVPFNKGIPRVNGAARRNGPGMVGNAGPAFAGRPKPRYPPGTPKPACSFFESNRCKNRDACTFQHLLPDGTDARTLGLNWAGVDGRTDNLEERGGLPPAWIANQRQAKLQMKHQNFNGGYSARDPRPPRARYEEAPAASPPATSEAAAAAPAAIDSKAEAAEPLTDALANGLPAPGSAPQLVAAINGLTRRIPPIANYGGNHNNTGTETQQQQTPASRQQQQQQQQQQQPAQRVPSGADFPALSSAPVSRPASPTTEADTPAVPVDSAAVNEKPSATVAPAVLSPTDEKEYVIVSHEDVAEANTESAVSNESKPATMSSAAPAPAPRIMGSFASAAARGASVPAPEKPRRQPATKPAAAAAPANKSTDEGKTAAAPPAPAVAKTDKPAGKKGQKNAGSTASAASGKTQHRQQAPAAVKASA
ncbi:hypothetical protein OIV83_006175 [Microbotryomycetes sp. JL201]|nr:hypothetical protein OIV83_006175 [Microbotryomycetes sp. JL201]